jgi:OPT family oligopeptide transporter
MLTRRSSFQSNINNDPEDTVTKDDVSDDRSDMKSDTDTSSDINSDIYHAIDAALPKGEDQDMPALTFRVWVLGTLFASVTSVINQFLSFRTTRFVIPSLIVSLILSYPLGVLMATILPKTVVKLFGFSFSFNPGKFNHKEHALIGIYASAGQFGFAVSNVLTQKYLLYENLDPLSSFGFVSSVQWFALGLGGLLVEFLVKPKQFIWPVNLGPMALISSFHVAESNDTKFMSRLKFFWMAAAAMAAYQLIPSFFAPALSSLSVLCFFAERNNGPTLLTTMGSGANGLGFLGLSFDWSQISLRNPITSPLWAILNRYCGGKLQFSD